MKPISKASFMSAFFTVFMFASFQLSAQQNDTAAKKLFIDVHRLEAGKVTYKDVENAHAKDLAVEDKYGVKFLKYWFDEKKGMVFCLASASDSDALRKTHAEAHGLLPERIYEITSANQNFPKDGKNLFLDIHYLNSGVSAKDVAAAHEKDLEVEKKYKVNFTNYLFDEKAAVVMCFAYAKDSSALAQTHKEAHGLIPANVFEVKPGK